MSKYTAEQVRDWHTEAHLACLDREDYESAQEHGGMADAIDALLREREAAKAGVTDKIVYRACKAGRITRDEPPEHELAAMRRKLEAVAPMLASARVPDGYRLQPLSEYDAMCSVLVAAPKPEKEEWGVERQVILENSTTEEFSVVPAHMTEVSKGRFFADLRADSRDVMPRPDFDSTRSLYSSWRVVHTQELWGWSHSDGRYARIGVEP